MTITCCCHYSIKDNNVGGAVAADFSPHVHFGRVLRSVRKHRMFDMLSLVRSVASTSRNAMMTLSEVCVCICMCVYNIVSCIYLGFGRGGLPMRRLCVSSCTEHSSVNELIPQIFSSPFHRFNLLSFLISWQYALPLQVHPTPQHR